MASRQLIDMGTFLFSVTETFSISGRGLVLTPGLGNKVTTVTTGSGIKLVRPDKSELTTSIVGIAFDKNHDIMIPSSVNKDDVPFGTEVWTVE